MLTINTNQKSTQQIEASKTSNNVGVVLLNWNGGEHTIPCIESLLKGSVIPWKIVVVDNGSNDGSPDIISDKFPEIYLIRNTKNRGFTGGNNQGIDYLLSKDIDYIWVLNNDTIVDQNCLGELLNSAKLYPEIACFTGKIYFDDPSDKIWYAGGYRNRFHLSSNHIGEGEIEKGKYDEIKNVEFISGCCMFFPRVSLNELSGFIEDYFIYSEDNEWSWRALNKGKSLLYVPTAKLWHVISASVMKGAGDNRKNGPSSFAWYLMIRNNLWTIRLHSTPVTRKYFAIAINIFIEIRMIINHLIRRDSQRAKSIFYGMCSGLFRGIPQIDTLNKLSSSSD